MIPWWLPLVAFVPGMAAWSLYAQLSNKLTRIQSRPDALRIVRICSLVGMALAIITIAIIPFIAMHDLREMSMPDLLLDAVIELGSVVVLFMWYMRLDGANSLVTPLGEEKEKR